MCANRAGSISEEKYKHCYSENFLFFLNRLQHTTLFLNHSFYMRTSEEGHTGVKGGSKGETLTDAKHVFPWMHD